MAMLILALISAAWLLWGVSNPPAVNVGYVPAQGQVEALGGLNLGVCDIAVTPIFAAASAALQQAIILHEVGHCLGLAHSTSPADIMFPTVTDPPSITVPSWHDLYRYHQTFQFHAFIPAVT